ncbi:hypothetical protein ACQKGC_25390 [Allorhizobium pseudoryzae]|uniref:hypothetical protein n=1 Tax=Allorhizobium pseudoryzae TaxID=379684 RepID=UPI003D03F9D0
MISPIDRQAALRRMEAASRETRHQLDMVERQIIRRMTALISSLGRQKNAYRRGRRPEPDAFLARYRSNLAAITAERQPEIDALSRKLARQEAAIDALRARRCLPNSERRVA